MRTAKHRRRKNTKQATQTAQVILLNKPFNVLCQFSDDQGRQTLKNFLPNKPNFYPAGRLDYDSEGLLLLTNNGKVQNRISSPKFGMEKTYLVQVDGAITEQAVEQLLQGVQLKDGPARALQAKISKQPVWLWERVPPVRYRANIPTSWLELTINEGRNRQVRRMTAAAGFPTLRLIRTRIGPWELAALKPGEHKLLNAPKSLL